ncbi:MAG: peptidoglycan-binding protein, partial [Gaiellaceae bacterium]
MSETEIDPDDWFWDAESAAVEERRDLTGGDVARGREPTWFEEVVEPEEPEPTAGSQFGRRRFVVLAGILLVLVVIVVVALVAFGGGGSSTPRVATTSPRATTTAPAPSTVPTTRPPTTTAVSLPAGPLKPGAAGAEVKALQRALERAGQSPGPIDADYGPKTEQAVSAFQRSAGITVDGTYGPQTKKALEQKLT